MNKDIKAQDGACGARYFISEINKKTHLECHVTNSVTFEFSILAPISRIEEFSETKRSLTALRYEIFTG